MDSTCRSELREANDLNFARFDAILDQRLAELKAELIKWARELTTPNLRRARLCGRVSEPGSHAGVTLLCSIALLSALVFSPPASRSVGFWLASGLPASDRPIVS